MSNICHDMENWAVQSPEEPGFHAVVTPDKSSCKEAWIYRLNLNKGDSHTLKSGRLEMHPVLCEGAAVLSGNSALEGVRLEKYDSFYIPGETDVIITAQEDCFFYVAAAVCEGYGEIFVRKFDPSLPIGDIHQIHGEGTGRREVMFTLAPQDKASRLLCGFTWGGEGTWTSWPPHQHEADLEEVYCYFDMPKPHFGFHISYLKSADGNLRAGAMRISSDRCQPGNTKYLPLGSGRFLTCTEKIRFGGVGSCEGRPCGQYSGISYS